MRRVKVGCRGKRGEMTQTLYAHMNKIKIKIKERNSIDKENRVFQTGTIALSKCSETIFIYYQYISLFLAR
jgi:hypothetical protein